LPGRRNIVLSRQQQWIADGAEVVSSLDAALALIRLEPAWVIGGAQVYKAAMPHAGVVGITEIDVDVVGDTHAPDLTGLTLRSTSEWLTAATGLRYRFLRYTSQAE
jgi:dihydrofolate reductase